MTTPAVETDTRTAVPSWPPVVVGALRRRRSQLAASATGRVLDVGDAAPSLGDYVAPVTSVTVVEPDPEAAARLEQRGRTLGLAVSARATIDDAADSGPFDTVVSVLGLPRWADLPAALSQIVASMADDAPFHFLEPILRPGPVGNALTPLSELLPTLAGMHLNRDVPSAVRAQGLTVISIERFTMPTLIWPLRSFAQATARRIEGPSR